MTLRRFLRWSEDQAAAAGLTPAQHQLLVAIKGHPGPEPPAIRELAEYLLLQSHSTVGLVDRAEAAGVVRREPDAKDARIVRVRLTAKGDRLVTELTRAHLTELYKLAWALNDLLPAQHREPSRTEVSQETLRSPPLGEARVCLGGPGVAGNVAPRHSNVSGGRGQPGRRTGAGEDDSEGGGRER